VGSAIVNIVAEKQSAGREAIVASVSELCRALADSIRAESGAKIGA
jgi:tryptophan synthase alpha subunit